MVKSIRSVRLAWDYMCARRTCNSPLTCAPTTLPRFGTAGVPHSYWFWPILSRIRMMALRFREIPPSFRGIEHLCTHSDRPVHGAMNPPLTPPPRQCPFLAAVAHEEPSERTVLTQIINTQDHRRSHLSSAGSWAVGSIVEGDVHVCVEGWALWDWCTVPRPDRSMGPFLGGNILILLFLCWDDVFKLTETWSVMGQPAEHTPEHLAQSGCFLLAGWWLLFLINEMFSLLWLMSHSHLNHSQTNGILCEIWTVEIRQRSDFLGKLGARCVQDIFLLSCVLEPRSTL